MLISKSNSVYYWGWGGGLLCILFMNILHQLCKSFMFLKFQLGVVHFSYVLNHKRRTAVLNTERTLDEFGISIASEN